MGLGAGIRASRLSGILVAMGGGYEEEGEGGEGGEGENSAYVKA